MTHSHPMHAAFLADIREHPEDDFPRQVYADWLEQYGDGGADLERAKFIRAQQSLSLLGPKCYSSGHSCSCCADLKKDERYWIEVNRSRLHKENHPFTVGLCRQGWVDDGNPELSFHRGFVWGVRCPTALWLQHRVELVTRHPVQRVELTDKRPLGPFEGRLFPIQWCVFRSVEYGSGPDELNEDLVGKRSALHIHFKDDEAAFDWLSSRLIARALELAGLVGARDGGVNKGEEN